MDFICVICKTHYTCPFGMINEQICGDCDEEMCKLGCCLKCTFAIVPLPAHIAAELQFTSARH